MYSIQDYFSCGSGIQLAIEVVYSIHDFDHTSIVNFLMRKNVDCQLSTIHKTEFFTFVSNDCPYFKWSSFYVQLYVLNSFML